MIWTGEFVPEAEEDPPSAESQDDHRVSAVSAGANVIVIPWKEGMEGDHTICALVGDNKTEGLVVARLQHDKGPISLLR